MCVITFAQKLHDKASHIILESGQSLVMTNSMTMELVVTNSMQFYGRFPDFITFAKLLCDNMNY